MPSTPKRTKSAMILPSDQAYVEPPHCRANRRQTTVGIKRSSPTMSIFLSLSERVSESSSGRSGILRNKRIAPIVTPPKGRLM